MTTFTQNLLQSALTSPSAEAVQYRSGKDGEWLVTILPGSLITVTSEARVSQRRVRSFRQKGDKAFVIGGDFSVMQLLSVEKWQRLGRLVSRFFPPSDVRTHVTTLSLPAKASRLLGTPQGKLSVSVESDSQGRLPLPGSQEEAERQKLALRILFSGSGKKSIAAKAA